MKDLVIGKWYGLDSKEFEQLQEGETVLIAPINACRGITHGERMSHTIDIAFLHDKKQKTFHATDGIYTFEEVKAWSYPPIPPLRTIINGELMDSDYFADIWYKYNELDNEL